MDSFADLVELAERQADRPEDSVPKGTNPSSAVKGRMAITSASSRLIL